MKKLINVQKDTAPDFEDAIKPLKDRRLLSQIMVACFLKEFGLTPEIREQAEREIKYITERLGLNEKL